MTLGYKCFDSVMHKIIKIQKGRQRSSLIFWLFDAGQGGGGVIVRQSFEQKLMEIWSRAEPVTL